VTQRTEGNGRLFEEILAQEEEHAEDLSSMLRGIA
jgi:bacterioferritin (cytochrome b1)